MSKVQAQKRSAKHEQWIEAMSDCELRRTALTTVFILFGDRALKLLGYEQKPLTHAQARGEER